MDTWNYDIRTWWPEAASPYIGNGFIGGNIPLDGHNADGHLYSASVAANYIGPDEVFVGVPHWLSARLLFNGQPAPARFFDFRQILNLKEGSFTTAYFDNEKKIRVQTETFCHRGIRNLAAYRMTIEALQAGTIELSPQLDRTHCPKAEAKIAAAAGDNSCGWTLDFGDAQRQTGQWLAVQTAGGHPQVFSSESAVGLKLRFELKAQQRVNVDVLVVTCVGAAPLDEGRPILEAACREGYEALKRSNAQEMEAQIWRNFVFEAENPYLERQVRSAMFYLTAGYRQDVVWGGCPSSLSSKQAWGNCVFWDTEFYMFPALLPFHPELAKNTLLYRYNTLPAARQNALERGEKGARFPWQSHIIGRGHGGVFEEEQHIGADIAFCCWWYANSTGDKQFFDRYGRELIVEAARNYAGRAIRNAAQNRYEIHGVISPDEHVWDHYAGRINNSVMTNFYVQWVLKNAAEIAGELATSAERDQWQRIAAGMYLPFNDERRIYWEYEGYSGHPIKQADVGHLFFPLQITGDKDIIRRTNNYYVDRERETGLYLLHSPFVYAAGFSRAGDVTGVRRMYDLAQRNVVGPFEIPRESNYGGGVCTSASGAFLGLVLYGLLGMENTGATLTAHPCIHEDIGALKAGSVLFDKRRYSVAGTPRNASAAIAPA